MRCDALHRMVMQGGLRLPEADPSRVKNIWRQVISRLVCSCRGSETSRWRRLRRWRWRMPRRQRWALELQSTPSSDAHLLMCCAVLPPCALSLPAVIAPPNQLAHGVTVSTSHGTLTGEGPALAHAVGGGRRPRGEAAGMAAAAAARRQGRRHHRRGGADQQGGEPLGTEHVALTWP